MSDFREQFHRDPKKFKTDKDFTHSTIDLGINLETVTSPLGRFYKTPTGNLYPSITTILGAASKNAITKWQDRVGKTEARRISTRASTRGTKLHALCEMYLLNMEVTTDHKVAQQLFEQVKPILDNHVGDIHMIEQSVYSDKLTAAGRLDLYGAYDDVPSIIDFKSSTRQKQEAWVQSYYAQGYAYSECIEELTGTRPKQVVIIIGVEDEVTPQVFKIRSDDRKAAEYFKEAKAMFKASIKARIT